MGLINTTYNVQYLLHPLIPKPLWGINPRSIMGGKAWKQTRKQIYADADYTCKVCGVKGIGKYEAHEVYRYNLRLWRQRLDEIICVCWMCHQAIHLQHNIEAGRILSDSLQLSIQNHRETLLKGQTLHGGAYSAKFDMFDTRWHLRYNGKSYYSDFANESEWAEYYNITEREKK